MNMSHPPRFLQSLIGLECTHIFDKLGIYVIVDVIPPIGRQRATVALPSIDLVLNRVSCSDDPGAFDVSHISDIKLTPASQAILFSRLGKTSDQEQ